jgi:hypothetical protein
MEMGVPEAVANQVSQSGLVLFDLAVRGRRIDEPLSDAATSLLELINLGARTLGREILQSSDPDDLDARLASVIERPGFIRLHGRFATRISRFQITTPSWGDGSEPAWLETVFEQDRELFLQANELLGAISQALVTAVQSQGEELAAQAEQAFVQPENPLALILHPGLPKDVAQGMLRGLYAGACLFAVLRMAKVKEHPPRWLRRALLSRWCEHLYGYLRLLASLPDVNVPELIVPLDDRVVLSLPQA